LLGVKPIPGSFQSPVRLAQPRGEHAHDLQGEVRRLADQKQELLLGHRDQFHVAEGNRRGATRLVVDQRHLAEDRVGPKLGDGPVADLDPDLATLDDEQLERVVALTEDGVAGLERRGCDAVAGQQAKARVVLHEWSSAPLQAIQAGADGGKADGGREAILALTFCAKYAILRFIGIPLERPFPFSVRI
jgi:hypothetical protein